MVFSTLLSHFFFFLVCSILIFSFIVFILFLFLFYLISFSYNTPPDTRDFSIDLPDWGWGSWSLTLKKSFIPTTSTLISLQYDRIPPKNLIILIIRIIFSSLCLCDYTFTWFQYTVTSVLNLTSQTFGSLILLAVIYCLRSSSK